MWVNEEKAAASRANVFVPSADQMPPTQVVGTKVSQSFQLRKVVRELSHHRIHMEAAAKMLHADKTTGMLQGAT